jgi:hypothetical protein
MDHRGSDGLMPSDFNDEERRAREWAKRERDIDRADVMRDRKKDEDAENQTRRNPTD